VVPFFSIGNEMLYFLCVPIPEALAGAEKYMIYWIREKKISMSSVE
jgi:hypothetical protein